MTIRNVTNITNSVLHFSTGSIFGGGQNACNKSVIIQTVTFLAEDNYVLGRTVLYTVTYNAFIYAKQLYVTLHKNKTCVTSLFSFIEGYKGLK